MSYSLDVVQSVHGQVIVRTYSIETKLFLSGVSDYKNSKTERKQFHPSSGFSRAMNNSLTESNNEFKK